MKSYTVTISKTVGSFGFFKGSCKTVSRTFYGVEATNMEQAQTIAEKKFDEAERNAIQS